MNIYLGDSVYVELDQFGRIILTTNNGYVDDPHNRIVLDQGMFSDLQRIVHTAKGHGKNESELHHLR